MAATIKIKNSSTTGAVPTSGDLVQGELAVNVTDTGLYTENASGTVVKLNAPSIDDKNTGATKHLTISTGGNLGLGVTPSAWSGLKAVEVGPGDFIGSNGGNGVWIGANTYYNGSNWVYKTTGAANYYVTGSGSHSWHTAASGTAGNTITFTQAMTLDASGNLGLGTTSPDDITSGYTTVDVRGSTGGGLRLGVAGGANMAIYASGSTSVIEAAGSAALQLVTNGSERARIDSSGNLLVGTTSASGKLSLTDTGNSSQSVYFEDTNTSFTGRVLAINATRNTTNGTYKFLECSISAVAVKLSIADSGNVTNANGSYGTISDVKVKENIIDATPKLDDVMRLKVRNFNLKTEPNNKQIGFVAQEFEQVFPAMIEESFDRDEEGNILEETTKSIKTSVLIPILVKAIQEQQTLIQDQLALINSLTARVEALENK